MTSFDDKESLSITTNSSIQLKKIAGNTGEIARLREKALSEFLIKLREREGENLLRVVLFGSVARGDSRADSDIDVFVLVDSGTRTELRDRIVDIATDAKFEKGECKIHITPFIKTLDEYKNRSIIGIPVFNDIDREGLILYDIEGRQTQ